MKRLLYYLLILLIATISLFYILPYPARYFTQPLKEKIEQAISRQISLPFSIGTIKYYFLNRIIIEDITINTPSTDNPLDPFCHIDRTILSFNIVSLLLDRDNIVGAIRKVRISGFTCRIPRTVPLFKSQHSKQLPDFYWENGLVQMVIIDDRSSAIQSVQFTDANGHIKHIPGDMYDIQFAGALKPIGTLSFKGNIRNTGRWQGTAAINIHRLLPEQLSRLHLVDPSLIDRFPWVRSYAFEGNGFIDLSLSGNITKGTRLVDDWHALISIIDSHIVSDRDGRTTTYTIDVDGALDHEKLSFSALKVILPQGTHLQAQGSIAHPFSTAQAGITFTADRLNCADAKIFTKMSFFDRIRSNGSAQGKITGSLFNPSVHVEFSHVNWTWRERIEGSFSAIINYKNKNLRVSNLLITHNDGMIRGEAHFMPTDWFATCRIDTIDIGNLLSGTPASIVSGKLNGNVLFKGTPEHPHLTGSLRIKQFGFIYQQFSDLLLTLDFFNDRMTVNAKTTDGDLVFDADVRLSDDDIALHQLSIESRIGTLAVSGFLKNKEGKTDLSLKADHIPAHILSPRFPFSKNIPGFVRFNGRVSGDPHFPRLIGSLWVGEDSVDYLHAEISCDFHELRIVDLVFLEQVNATGRFNLSSGEYEIHVSESDFEIALLSEFVHLPIPMQGKISGKQSVYRMLKSTTAARHPLSGIFGSMRKKIKTYLKPLTPDAHTYFWQAEAHCIIKNGRIDGIDFDTAEMDIDLHDETLLINTIAISQKKGSFTGSGNINVGVTENNILFNAGFKQLSWKNILFDGDIAVSGDFISLHNFSLSIFSPSFWLQGKKAGELNGSILFRQGKLQFQKWKLSNYLSGEAVLDFNHDVPLVDGSIRMKLDDLSFLNEITSIEQWRDLTGSGWITLDMGGTVSRPVFDLKLDIQQARFKEIDLSLTGSMYYKDNLWEIPSLKLDFKEHGSLVLKGQYAGKNELVKPQLEATLSELDFEIARSMVNLPSWIHGVVNGSITMSGTISEPILTGTLSGKQTLINTVAIDHWQGQLTLTKNKLEIHTLTLSRDSELWNITDGSYITFSTDKEVSFLLNLEVRNMYIGPFSFFGGMNIRGTWNFSPGAENEIEVITQNLYVNQHEFERTLVRLQFVNDQINFLPIESERFKTTGSINISSYPAVEIQNFQIIDNKTTIVHLDGRLSDEKVDFWFKSRNTDISIILNLLDLEKFMTGKANLYWVMTGTLSNPRITCTINSGSGSILKVPYDHINAHWSLRDNILKIDTGELAYQDQYALSLKGTIPITRKKTDETLDHNEKSVRLILNMPKGDLKMLTYAVPFFKSAHGNVTGRLEINGTVAHPVYTGYFKISDGLIHSKKYFKTLRNLNAFVTFEDTTATIDPCQAKIGEGLVDIQGRCTLGWLEIKDFDFYAKTIDEKGIKIEAPMLPISSSPFFKRITSTSHGKPRIDLSLKGTPELPRITGTVYLDNTYFTFPPPPKIKKTFKTSENLLLIFIRRTYWDLKLIAGNNTWYENQFANTSIIGDINILGRYPNFKISGKIESGKGSIGFLGSEFLLKNAVLEIIPSRREELFDQREWINTPYLEGTAETKIFYRVPQTNTSIEDTITLIMDRSPIGRLKPRFISKNDPDLSSDKALERATGLSAESIDPRERNLLLKRGILQILDASLTTPIARNLARHTGLVDTVRIAHETLPDTTNPLTADEKPDILDPTDFKNAFLGTKYIVGKQLSSKLLLEYSMQIIGLEYKLDLRHEIELSYRLQGNMYLRGITDLNQSSTGYQPESKAVIEKRWRFSWPPSWFK